MRRAHAGAILVASLLLVFAWPQASHGQSAAEDPRVEGSVAPQTFNLKSSQSAKTGSLFGAKKSRPGKTRSANKPAILAKPATPTKPVLPTWLSVSTNDGVLSSVTVGGWSVSVGNPCGAGTNLVPVAVNEFTPTVAGRTGAVRLMGTTCEVAAVAAAVMAAPRPVVVTTEMFASIDLRQRRTECTCHDVGEQIPAFVVGVPAVFWQDAEPEVVTTTLQGQVVELRATPVAWVMEWGDGSVQLRSKVPGVKWDVNPREKHPSTVAGSLWHVWEHRGYYDLKQTIDYKGEFRVNGGAWQTIAGTVTKPGPSTKVKIRSFIALEVDEDY